LVVDDVGDDDSVEDGTVVERAWYEAYGKATLAGADGTAYGVQSSQWGNEHLFTGQRHSGETRTAGNFGLYYYKNRDYDPTLGRFITRDPAGYVDGLNPYEYVRSAPARSTDPSGLKTRISVNEDACTITITLNIGIYGKKASDALAKKIATAIRKFWNGHTTQKGCDDGANGNCRVEVEANVKYYPKAKHWWDIPEDNQVKFTGSTTTSWVSGGSYGHWRDNAGEWTLAHEAGHIMGLGDDYSENYLAQIFGADRETRPKPGHEGHMMAEGGGVVVQHEVDEALKGAECPQSCCGSGTKWINDREIE